MFKGRKPMKVKAIYLAVLALFTASARSPCWAGCLEYEPVVVELEGKLTREIFPGLPNFEDVKKGDEPEVAWVLQLAKPICVNAKRNDSLNKATKDIKAVQLVMLGEGTKDYRAFVGKRVVVKGALFHGHTGHHHTEVLLTVKNIRLNH